MARNRRRKHKDDGPATLGRIFTRLTRAERAIIVARLQTVRGLDFHLGMLPFVNYMEAVRELRSHNTRLTWQLASKVIELMGLPTLRNTKFLMYLDPIKVRMHFGKNPEIGKPIPALGALKVTAGMKWSLPKKMYVPDDNVTVHPSIALTCIPGPPRMKTYAYYVHVISSHRTSAKQWLLDYCT